MKSRDDDDFRPKVGPPKDRGQGKAPKFISRVLKAASKSGRPIGRRLSGKSGRPARSRSFGRGQVAARVAGRGLDARARRVIVKIHPVNLRHASTRTTEKHLSYLERDGVRRDGSPGELFNESDDRADREGFTERSADDRHQFRIIVSPEEGAELGDLKRFAQQLMNQAERDLGTRLEWVAVDHWDTDQPHIQIVLRGKDDTGKDLVICPEYIAYGLRARARELATEWLGPRTELEIRASLQREVTQERFTSLDREILAQAKQDRIVVRESSWSAEARFRTGLLLGRLDHLCTLGLAEKSAPLSYTLHEDLEPTLRSMGERGDVIRTLQRAMNEEPRDYAIFDHNTAQGRVVGRVVKRAVDPWTDRDYLIVDAIDGKAYYVSLAKSAAQESIARGAVVEVRGVESRPADPNILAASTEGLYRTDQHLANARPHLREGMDPENFVQAHERRLEALRRAGIVERLEPGVWKVPPDLIERGLAYDARQADGAGIRLRSNLSIEQQTRVLGATWLDEQLLRPDALAPHGFGATVRTALQKRSDHLVEQGLARKQGQRVSYTRDLLKTLRQQELEVIAKRIQSETGLDYRPAQDGQRVSGRYARALSLNSGRYAMLQDLGGFSLVPWRPFLEQHRDKAISATVRDAFVSFDLRSRDLGR